MSSLRYDRGTLRPARRMKNGTLRADAIFTRTGVFEYLNPDGTIRREYRPPEEVFHQDSLDSFVGVPVTDGHPPEMVTAENAEKYSAGSLGENIRRDGQFVVGPVFVHRASLVKKLDAGDTGVSFGYTVDEDWTPGVTPEGERYDLVQRNIRGNHLALGVQARAGESARVRMDAAIQQPEKDHQMDEKQAEALKAQVAGLQSEVASEKARADAAEGKLQAAETELANLKKAREDEAATKPEELKAQIKERVVVETFAREVLPTETKFDELDNRTLMVAVVEKLHGKKLGDDKSIEVVRDRFDQAVEGYRAGQAAGLELVRQDAANAPKSEEQAYQDMVERNQNAWKQPVGSSK